MKRSLLLHDGTLGDITSTGNREVISLWDPYSSALATMIWHEVKIVVGDVTKLQGVVAFARELGRTTRLSVEVHERVSINLLHGPVGPVDGREVLTMSRDQTEGRTTLNMRLGFHSALWVFLASTLSAPLSRPNGLGPGIRLGIGQGVDPNWLGLSTDSKYIHEGDGRTIDLENPGPLPRMDVAIVTADGLERIDQQLGESETVSHTLTAIEAPQPEWRLARTSRPAFGPPLETRIFNPIGVNRAPTHGWVYLRPGVAGSTLVSDNNGSIVAEFREITAATIEVLRSYWGVVDTGAAFDGPATRAAAISRLAASGVPVVSPDARTTLRGWMPDELLEAVDESLPKSLDAEDRERAVIRQVRSAHRVATWRSASYRQYSPAAYDEPSVSVGIATMRPEYLGHVLSTFESQTWTNKQLLLGLHGFSLADVAPEIRQRVSKLATVVEWPRDGIFGDLLRELTVRADGDLFAKMDDDDWYAPYHLEDLVYALQYSGATLVGSGVQFVYMHSADITIRRSIDQSYRYGGHPGGPTFLASRDTMLRAGNWPRVRRAVDTGFNDAVLALGGIVYQSHAHNFLFNRRSAGHTWKATNSYFIEKAKFFWDGIRPPAGFDGSTLPNLEWRSAASTIAPLHRFPTLIRRVDPAFAVHDMATRHLRRP